MKYLLFIVLTSCAVPLASQPTEDCVTRHVKALARGGQVLPETYEKVVEACQAIYTGRP